MARPKTKQELLDLGEINCGKLLALIDGLTIEQQNGEFGFDDRDRNIRDVLIHLYEWQNLLLKWERKNMAGEAASFLREGYNWKTYPAMNVEIWREYQNTDLETAKNLITKSHDDVRKMISRHSDEELFVKKFYSWTGNSSLGAYCISATSSHYDWAIKKLKKYVAELK